MSCKMNSNCAYIHGYCSLCKQFFNIIFSHYFLYPVKRLLFPNHYNNPARQNNHPTTKPSATTKHRNLAQSINQTQLKINPKSTKKPKIN